ncbi:hypothetical protein NE237_020878 [Protea cynaroides]|uniref:Uncharacterized protein n=1 Tax=Protea cynaroides TaxID=273540 RepID=A0A9Q0HA23_9MAGN|nr:hypothetical protein NE237_020878 [Protea cynaroides]
MELSPIRLQLLEAPIVNPAIRVNWLQLLEVHICFSGFGSLKVEAMEKRASKVEAMEKRASKSRNSSDLLEFAGILCSLINEVTPPWLVLVIRAVMNLGGYPSN